MTAQRRPRGPGTIGVLSFLSYAFAAVTLAGGLILTVAIVSAAGDAPDALLGLRGLGPLLSPLAGTLHTAIELAAVATFVLSILLSALLLALGGLLAAVDGLGRRVDNLEQPCPGATRQRDLP
ncbi:MAG: hypothetical protein MUF84_12005 [Anaerolineae bacterium]|nr:hypothetical protein [Anaerolineae bacterium]